MSHVVTEKGYTTVAMATNIKSIPSNILIHTRRAKGKTSQLFYFHSVKVLWN